MENGKNINEGKEKGEVSFIKDYINTCLFPFSSFSSKSRPISIETLKN